MNCLLRKCRPINRALASLAVIFAVVCLPSMHYTNAHLHYFYGAVIAHWHPSNGLSPEQTGKKTPTAEHNHALSDLFNLWNIEKHQGNPAELCQPQVFLVIQYDIEVPDFFTPELTTSQAPTGRSPPADRA